ncbi:MAG TPA: bifunctional diguanylate cyclase/phosphodiesterase [Rhizomicrobium sp.]|nr:bifunctional diguanylate cyclase/phosphodiesterase [Rhizomicrobium sp.]
MLKTIAFLLACLTALFAGTALADTAPAKTSLNFAGQHMMLELQSSLRPYVAHAGKEPDGSAWYMLSVANSADRPVARVIRAGQPPGAGLDFFPRRGKPQVLQVASSDAGVTVEPARAFGRHAFLVTVPPATSATIAVRILYADTPPSIVAWTVPALVLHNKQLAIFLAAVAGLIAASIAITTGVAVMTSHLASRWAAITLVATFLVEIANGGVFDSGWMTAVGGPYGFSAMLLGLALAAAIRLADLVAPVSEAWPNAVPALVWTQRGLLALCALAFLGLPGAALLLQIAAVIGSAGIAVYLVHRGMLGAQAARVVAPSAAIFSLVTLAAAVVALGGFTDNPAASAIIGGFAAVGAVLLALAIAAGEGISILSGVRPSQLLVAPAPATEPPPVIERPAIFGNSALQAIGASHQGVFDLDFQREVVKLSAEAASLIGYPKSAQSMPHDAWIARVHTDDREVYCRAMEDYRNHNGLAFRIEFRVRSESGRFPWFELRATMMGGKDEAARCLGLMADVTTRKESEAAVIDRALRDPLTGLGNRVALMEELDQLGDDARNAAFALLDIDRFKAIHASLGDRGGDEILVAVAKRLTQHLGSRAKVFRVGGDGFAVLAPGLAASAAALGSELVDLCSRPIAYRSRDIFAPASAGAVAGNDAEDPFVLLKNAELALQLAKRQGGACSRLYSQELDAFAPGDAVALESELRSALEKSQLDVYYQPIVHLPDENVAGFEALLRWRHPERGLLMPDEFIAHAEETGLIIALGRFALERAASDLAEWQHYFPVDPPLSVSVNVSKRQFRDPDFVSLVRSVLAEHELAPGTLKLEITESAISTSENARAIVLELEKLGIGLAIDDFGTGVSTLGQLREVPFDTLKVDKSFLAPAGNGSEGMVILNSIVSLARDLNRTLVIEGVENSEDLARVKAMDCEYAQGFFYSVPLSASDVLNFIARNYGTPQHGEARSSGASGVGG